jgi:hypothetical protein
MFRFAIAEGTPLNTNASQMAAAGITEDPDFAERHRETGEYRAGLRHFRVENRTPTTPTGAVEYVQGILSRAPDRVWLDGELHEVTDAIAAVARKPGV